MNISMNNMNSYISQLSQTNSGYSTSSISKAFQNQSSDENEISISSEGKAMSRMMRKDQSIEEMEANKAAFQETYSELKIETLDAENMTDEEIAEVLSAFESLMAEHMQEGYKSSSEMDSSELKDTLTKLQGMNEQMNGAKGHYGPPPGGKGGMKGAKPVEMDMMQSIETDDEEDEDDLIATLLEALEAQEEETSFFSAKSMDEILELISQTGNNI